MSTNTDTSKKHDLPNAKKAEGGGLAFLKKGIWTYIPMLVVIIVFGKIMDESGSQELWNQSFRNAISFAGLIVLAVIGLVKADLLFLILLLYVPFVDALPGRFGGETTALNLFNILSILMVICLFVNSAKKQQSVFVRNSANKVALMFAVFSIISYVINGFAYGTDYLIEQIFNLKRWLDPVLLYAICASLTVRKDIRRDAIMAILLGVSMVIFLAIKDVGQITHFSEERRIGGVGSQPNMLGAFVSDYMYMFLGILFVNFRKKIFWIALVPFSWGIRTIAVSFSRGAYAAFIIGTLAITFIRNKALCVITAAIFIFIAANTWLLPLAVQERISMTVKGEEVYGYGVEFEKSASSRVDAWKATLEMIKDKPLFGHGTGMVGTYLAYYAAITIGDVHNSYLLLAAEYGLALLSVFLATLFLGLRVSWTVYRYSEDELLKGAALGFIAGVVALSVNCFFGSHMTTLWEIGYFWALLAIFANEVKDLKDDGKIPQHA